MTTRHNRRRVSHRWGQRLLAGRDGFLEPDWFELDVIGRAEDMHRRCLAEEGEDDR